MIRVLLAVGCLLVSAPVLAATPTADEINYLQKMQMVGNVVAATWKAFEDKGVENRELNALSAEIIDAAGRKLRAAPPASESVKPVHEQLLRVLDAARAVYDAAAAGKMENIEALGKALASEQTKLEAAGNALEERLR